MSAIPPNKSPCEDSWNLSQPKESKISESEDFNKEEMEIYDITGLIDFTDGFNEYYDALVQKENRENEGRQLAEFVFKISDIVKIILSYLTFGENINVSEVNKLLYTCSRDTIARNSYLDRNIVPMCSRSHQDSKLQFYSRLSEYKLSILDLTGCSLTNETLKNLLEKLKFPESLNELILDTKTKFKLNLEVASEFTQDGNGNHDPLVEFILSRESDSPSAKLTDFTLGLSKCTELVSITIRKCHAVSKNSFENLANTCTKLQKLYIEYIPITRQTLIMLAEKCKKINDFSYCHLEILDDDENRPEVMTADSFNLEVCNMITENWKELKKLQIMSYGRTSEHTSHIASRLQSLEHLVLSEGEAQEEDWLGLAQRCSTALKSLYLSDVSNVPANMFEALGTRCPNLKKVNFFECGLSPNEAAVLTASKEHCPGVEVKIFHSKLRM